MRESFVFYKSFYEAIKELPKKYRLELYDVICEYSLYGEIPELEGITKAFFLLMKPNVDTVTKKYDSNVMNGKKGGRPKKDADEEIGSTAPIEIQPNINEQPLEIQPKIDDKSMKTTEKPIDNPTVTQEKPNENLDKDKDKDKDFDKDLNWDDDKDLDLDIITAESSDEFPAETKAQTKTERKDELKPRTVVRPNPKPENVVEYLPLLDGTNYPVSKTESAVWNIAYPALNVPMELHQMRAWLDANPKNRKSLQGIKRFIVNWLSRSQDRAKKIPGEPTPSFDLDEFFNAALLS